MTIYLQRHLRDDMDSRTGTFARRVTLPQAHAPCVVGQIRFTFTPILALPKRGVSRTSRTLGRNAMGVSLLQRDLIMRTNNNARTVKSCGPDTPTLVSRAMRLWRVVAIRWPTSPVHRGEHEAAVKAIARGRPDVRLVPVVLPRAFSCTRTAGATSIRPSLRPLLFRRVSLRHNSGVRRRENGKAYPTPETTYCPGAP
jgi:hypothetical protein